MRVSRLAPLALVGCNLVAYETPTPVPTEPTAQPAPTEPGADDATFFAGTCEGNGPEGPVTRIPVPGVGDVIQVPCEWFAYQGTYELWLQASGGEPVHQLNRLGVGGLDERTGQWTNLEKARGPGDCGVFERFDITATGITLVQTREQGCGDGSTQPNVDPDTWPLVGPANGCEGAKDFFRCEVASGKVAQLCGADDGSWLTYQFGAVGAPELVYPPDRAPSQFGGGQTSWVRAQADYVAFENADHRYILVNKVGSGARGEGEMNNFTGIIVQKDGQELARISCTGQPEVEGFATVASQLTAVGYLD